MEDVTLQDSLYSFDCQIADCLLRKTEYLTHPVFQKYHSETEMLRYIFKLMSRDLSLAQSMIPLGSCTMKLNGTTIPDWDLLGPFGNVMLPNP